ncbi:MAG: tRNA (adenosine(37)-N6)-threonylcarbamoyltransferase complex dimerization subunit type 1 TsaB, partial [Candidatus Tectomicrobia bacterium]|nr:tRNA (adenosine(37)-N6)-threonylcarbamoyltransferase complex dimerization subunit type 1 TsaB [Candidatus Tectomicrobia bacterium]
MQVLGIDSSTSRGGVAIANEQGIVATFTLSDRLSYSQRLLSMIHLILERAHLSIEELDGFAIACGPGSFTGLRIGISMAKGLALATGKPAIGIPTLDALAYHLCFSTCLVCPLLDARRGEVYTAFYRAEGREMRKLTDDLVLSPEEFCMMIREPVILLGDGLVSYGEMLKKTLRHLAIL